MRSRSPQNHKCGHFTLLFCRGRQRNVLKFKTHVQSDCFCSFNKPIVLRRCHCRRRCLSSLYATTTVTPMKTTLENTSLCNLYYFALIPIRSTSTTWPNCPPVTELMGTIFKLAQRMKIYCHVLTLSIKP